MGPAEQGQGLAKKIIEQVIRILRADGVPRVELMPEADNLRARAFYEKLGFEHEGRLRAAYKRGNEDVYVDELLIAVASAVAAQAGLTRLFVLSSVASSA